MAVTRMSKSSISNFAKYRSMTAGIGFATGGTITTVGDYTVHTFTSTGTLTVKGDLPEVEYLVVGGGGGAKQGGAGGGGYRISTGETSGGGSLSEEPISLSSGVYTVVVGAGGPITGGDGSPSSFSNITAKGSQGHYNDSGTFASTAGTRGGSAPQAADTNQGFPGGQGNTNGGAAGGGGAGAAGQNANSNNSGSAGGDGLYSSIDGVSTGRAGGGAGGGAVDTNNGANEGGGIGGGSNVLGGDGTINTGGGGGGSWLQSLSGGAGGSGIVIIRYK